MDSIHLQTYNLGTTFFKLWSTYLMNGGYDR